MVAMRLTPWEEERLLVFTAAELARRHLAAGLALNAPEAVALICDAMFEAARAGASYAVVETAGRTAVRFDQVMPGVVALVDEVILEVLLDDGTRLVVLHDPIGDGTSEGGTRDDDAPGAVRLAPAAAPGADDRPRQTLVVTSTSRRTIRVSSHHPFERVNQRLQFDREAATGYRLDLPAGSAERWAPGETRTVVLVRFGGEGQGR
jgi:urease subunit gamma/beta